MKRYLREIQTSGFVLMLIGLIMHRLLDMQAGVYACGIGILLWLTVLLYKAFHWQEYRRDNVQNIAIMLIVILLLFFLILQRQ